MVAWGLDTQIFAAVAGAAADAVRASLEQAWIDVLSDRPWPAEVAAPVARLTALAQARKEDALTAVDIDPENDEEFAAFVSLLPFTINAEGWIGTRHRSKYVEILSVSDSGASLLVAPNPAERADLFGILNGLGIPPEGVFHWAAPLAD